MNMHAQSTVDGELMDNGANVQKHVQEELDLEQDK